MVTQIVFNIDPKIKVRAMKRAKAEGVPFAAFLKKATEAFADGEYRIGIVRGEVPNARTGRALRKASAAYKKGNSMSPVFTSGKDMDAYLGI